MVPVGNEEFLRRHGLGNLLDQRGIIHNPNPMSDPKIVPDLDLGAARRGRFIQNIVDRKFVVAIQREDQVLVAFNRAHETQPVFLRFRQGALVRQNPRPERFKSRRAMKPRLSLASPSTS